MSYKDTITVVKTFIVASNPVELVRLQVETNLLMGARFEYDIVPFKGKWYAWFQVDILEYRNKLASKEKAIKAKDGR